MQNNSSPTKKRNPPISSPLLNNEAHLHTIDPTLTSSLPATSDAFKCGTVAIIGRPSVGKSTFLNSICGNHTAIVSPYPQTTRNIIRGIVTRDNFQIIFLDTPGLHFSESSFSITLKKQSLLSLSSADVILYMVDISRKPGEEEIHICNILKDINLSLVITVNKIDITQNYSNEYKEHFAHYLPHHTISQIMGISAKESLHTELLLTDIAKHLPDSPPLYPKDYYTDQSFEMRVCEIVRESAIDNVKEELPHAIYTNLIESSIKHRNNDNAITHVFARVDVIVETESQKKILIGKSGSMVKKIRVASSKKLVLIFPYNIQLEIRISVQKKWRKNKATLQKVSHRF